MINDGVCCVKAQPNTSKKTKPFKHVDKFWTNTNLVSLNYNERFLIFIKFIKSDFFFFFFVQEISGNTSSCLVYTPR